MTLTIHKLSTRCRTPRGLERHGALVDDIARGMLASELQAQLGPSLDRLPAVVRLKELRVKLRIPGRNLNATSLAAAWARAFTLALHRALAYPPGDGFVSSRRHESAAAYKASLLHHLAARGLSPSWEFPELEAWRGSLPAKAALGILLQDPGSIPGIVVELERRRWIEPVLALWDELSLEHVMRTIAEAEARSPALSLDDLIELGSAAAASGSLRPEWTFAGRRQAIRLWARLYPRFPLRGTWHGLRLLLRFLELPALLILRDPALLADPIPFPHWCEAIVAGDLLSGPMPADSPTGAALPAIRGRMPWLSPTGRASSTRASMTGLNSVLERLRPLAPSAATPVASGLSRSGTKVKWIVSDYAGILLMLSVVQRLDLWRLIDHPEFVRFGGPRALSFFLAGVGMTLVKRWSVGDSVEPAVALFAGTFDELDLAGMRQFFSQASVSAVRDFVQAETWEVALDLAATELSRSFAGRVRGFRDASRETVVKQFVRLRGRVLVEPARILVVLASTPWAVALHLSGMDESLAPVERMDYRRVEFVMEGL
jgi:hypothetical protein